VTGGSGGGDERSWRRVDEEEADVRQHRRGEATVREEVTVR
jgi:hypothetical protein